MNGYILKRKGVEGSWFLLLPFNSPGEGLVFCVVNARTGSIECAPWSDFDVDFPEMERAMAQASGSILVPSGKVKLQG